MSSLLLVASVLVLSVPAPAARAGAVVPVARGEVVPAARTARAVTAFAGGYLIVRPGLRRLVGVQSPAAAPAGLAPADLQSAYQLAAASGDSGKGATVAVINAYDDPAAASDLAVYRAQYGLPACTVTSGCFQKVNQDGAASPLPPSSRGYSDLASIEMDMVSAICPNCRILLVEARSPGIGDTGPGVDSAVALGAKYVALAADKPGSSSQYERYLNHPGVAITASLPDTGYDTNYFTQAASQYVTAVGGTTLNRASNARGWTETVWPYPIGGYGDGSGCATDLGKPSWQTDAGCAGRTDNDVAAVADSDSGIAYYDTHAIIGNGWLTADGTAVSEAIVAAIYALAGKPQPGTYPASYPYLHHSAFYQMTGTDWPWPCSPAYLCTAGPGYNGPVGWGTPDGIAGFRFGPVAGDYVAVTSPGTQSATRLPAAVRASAPAVDSAVSQLLTYTATGLPAGVSINPATGAITGTVSAAYLGTTTVTATDPAGAHASASFRWNMQNAITVPSPGTQQTEPATSVSLTVHGTDAAPGQTLIYTAAGLPQGLSIDPATGTISGTTSPAITTYTVTVTATDSTGSTGSVSFTWHIWNQIQVTIPGGSPYSTYGVPIVPVQVNATDSASGLPLTYSSTWLPAGLSLDPHTGIVSGTPTQISWPSVTITVTDGTGSIGSVTFTWTVHGILTIKNPGNLSVAAGAPVGLALKVTYTGGSLNWVTYSAAGLPAGLSIEQYYPWLYGFAASAGTYQVTATAHAEAGPASLTTSTTFTVTVTNPGTGPTGPVKLDLAGMCLDDRQDSSANGTPIQIWKCLGDPNQRWTLGGDGTIRINGKCLDTVNGSTATATKTQLWTCDGKPSQVWTPSNAGELSNPATRTCLAAPGSSTQNGTPVEIMPCNATQTSDRWTAPAGPIMIDSINPPGTPPMCMTVKGGRTADGTPVESDACNGSAAQTWTIGPDHSIRAMGKCLGYFNIPSPDYLAPVAIYTCPGYGGTGWDISGTGNGITSVIRSNYPGQQFCLLYSGENEFNGYPIVVGTCNFTEGHTGTIYHVR